MSRFSLGKKFLISVMFLSLVMSSAGCVYVAVGGLGVLGGYVVSPDTVEGVISIKDYDEVWDAVIETVSVMGIIEDKSEAGGVVNAKINGAKVTVKVIRMTSSATKLSIKARKALLPKVRIAQKIYVKVVNYLDNGG